MELRRRRLSSGMYFYRLEESGADTKIVETRKMVVLR